MSKRKQKGNFPDSLALFINGRVDERASDSAPKDTAIPLPIKLICSLIQELCPNEIPGCFQSF